MTKKPLTIVLIEPYFTGSHADWAQGYRRYSRHHIELLTLPGKFWKWRMHGGAISLATAYQQQQYKPDLILSTDMLDLTTFLACTRKQTHSIPTAIYFHENQLSYPWQTDDRDVQYQRDHHYGFINYASAVTSDLICFNSNYHYQSFVYELKKFLNRFPDFRQTHRIEEVKQKSKICYLGLELDRLDAGRVSPFSEPLVLWNHRWEYDKNADEFFAALFQVADMDISFKVAVLGESFAQKPEPFMRAKQILGDRIVQWGYVKEESEYIQWLWRAHVLPVTSIQEFFGASVVEGIYCNCYPLLPKRLSYPELIPAQTYPQHFYTHRQELVQKLAMVLSDVPDLEKRSLRHCVERFNWKQMAVYYDDLFESLINQRKRVTA